MILDLNYRCNKVLLAELNSLYFITQSKRVVSKLQAYNEFAYPIEPIQSNQHLELSDGEYAVAMQPYLRRKIHDVKKHLAGQHDQSEHGHRSGSKDGQKQSKSVLERVRNEGGLTIRMADGSSPIKGYMVSRKGMSKIVADKDFFDETKGKKILSDYLKEHRSELTTGKDYLGIWHNKENHKVYLDVSMNVMDKKTAIRLGQENNQISIWDIVKKDEIATGGTGND